MRVFVPVLLAAAAILGLQSCKSKGSDAVVAAPTQPGTGAPAAPAGAETISGTVLERIDASPYCYLRLKTAKGEVWAAVPEAKIEKGAEITLASPMLMNNFESKTLKRTFPEIYFGNVAPAGGAPATPAATPAPGANPHAQVGNTTATIEVGKVDKASGSDARTVAEIWAQKGSLKGKTVTVRGKVVRYSAGVMGKNWMHLQNGSGDASKGTNDITVTSQDGAAKGDVVTAKGTVTTDKDFGAGYTYAMIIEEAKVQKK
jgi:hypothetical protein